MGDRSNVYMKDGDVGVFFYAHWLGDDIAVRVRDALKKKQRWDDTQYLGKIVFREIIRGHEDDETGFGVTAKIWDNGYPVIVLDPAAQKAHVLGEGYKRDWSDLFTLPPLREISFGQLCEMTDEQVRAWMMGKGE